MSDHKSVDNLCSSCCLRGDGGACMSFLKAQTLPLPIIDAGPPRQGAADAADRSRLVRALAAVSSPSAVNETLAFILTPQCLLQVTLRGDLRPVLGII